MRKAVVSASPKPPVEKNRRFRTTTMTITPEMSSSIRRLRTSSGRRRRPARSFLLSHRSLRFVGG